MNMLRKLLHPDFIEIGYSGSTYDYAAIISELSQETRPNYTVWSQDFECHDLSPGAKLLVYKSAHLHPNGSFTRHAKRASVWINIPDDWQIKYHQATPIAGFTVNA
ncbi:nuclear transport factor 2 family protein [Exilibacterium tricleocarpae]|uniref:Nuclear transport factor 2 family protein n=1 Tax=Exilibacterium tricleocarpae TaxID=2591008 RepID=A0A545SL45_9GAMM|nr:nuclear transport factor 2 family protein [Exilibacterium tricleocarpae]TQV65688.1 nuclear transport factor 2 family protein [Exilibacterium tricleocarpae]